MEVDKGKLYLRAEDFFEPSGNVSMRLSPDAAIAVCQQAAARGIFVGRIEGGIKRDRQFEARVDCIWAGVEPPLSQAAAHENNLKAASFIKEKSDVHNAFILTTCPLDGYRRTEAS